LQGFTLVQPLNGVGVSVTCGFEFELLCHAWGCNISATPTINDEWAHLSFMVHLKWKTFSLCSSWHPL